MRHISEVKSSCVVGTSATERRYEPNEVSPNLTGAIDVCAGVESRPLVRIAPCPVAKAWRRPDFFCLIPEGDLVDDTTVSNTLPDKDSTDDNSQRSLELALAAARTASENRGRNIVVLDLREVTPVFDFFVIATGSSRRQLHAMSEEIDHKLEDDLGDKRMGIEGYSESRWILLDYGTVVIHLFDDETREYYDIENLWTQAKRIDLTGLIETTPAE